MQEKDAFPIVYIPDSSVFWRRLKGWAFMGFFFTGMSAFAYFVMGILAVFAIAFMCLGFAWKKTGLFWFGGERQTKSHGML